MYGRLIRGLTYNIWLNTNLAGGKIETHRTYGAS